jgi:3-dehydroquinate synthase
LTEIANYDVRVELAERSYDIHIGTGNLAEIGSILVTTDPLSHAVIVTDTNVEAYATTVAESIADVGANVDILTIEAGEPSKSAAAVAALWEEVFATGADRKTMIVAVGGGVVGDLAGFIAATFARGLSFVQVPTTLLAQVDSSVGGKTGINLSSAKNMVGAFWQPTSVLIDTDVLSTLPDRDYVAGLAEVIKYGVIQDPDFFDYLEQHIFELKSRDAETLRYVVSLCCRLKADVVEADERETTGRRAILNYGHTFAHALEAASGYGELMHGEAVSIGMVCAARLAESMGRIDGAVTSRQHALIQAVGLPVSVPDLKLDKLMDLMMHDKKVEYGRLRFILPNRLGNVELVSDVDPDLVRAAWTG